MFGEVRLPLDWPVYLSHAEATAYANVAGKKIADRSAVSSRRVRKPANDWHRAFLSVG